MFSFSSFFDLTVPPQPVVNSSDLVNCTIAPNTITLQCFWSDTSNYVAWYKDGVLISSEDLASNTTLMSPSVGAVSSSFDDRMSVLTIMNSSFNDSGNYICAVSCGARNVSFDDIPPEVTDSIVVSVYGEHIHMYCTFQMFSCHNVHLLSVCVSFDLPDVPESPANFSGMVVMDDTDPVTVMFTWDGLVGEGATGIPSNGDQSLNYTVSIDGTSTTVTTSMEIIEVTYLTSCTEYSANLMASNKVNVGPSTTVNFTTTEKGEYDSILLMM